MIFDKKKKGRGASLCPTTKTNLLHYEKKTKRLHIATIEDFLTTLGICCESLSVVVRIKQVDHRA